jgi:DNA-binding NtrC family response regulator
MTCTVLLVDDDPVQCRLLDALARLRAGRGRDIDVVLLDLALADADAPGLIRTLAEAGIATPVIVQTTPAAVDGVGAALRAGAVDFVVKPVGAERLQVAVKNALRVASLEQEIRRRPAGVPGGLTLKDLTTRSPDMNRVLRLAERAAKSANPLLIEGEPGVGKTMLARAIQATSERRAKPFLTVHCGTTPEHLIEALLFGHDRAGPHPAAPGGTGGRQPGKFVQANGGTLFLDEVGALPHSAQAKLLQALNEGIVPNASGRRPVRIDVRLISATSTSLLDLVKNGRFREDLYYRLNVLPMTLPPVRARPEDVPDLARSFLARFAAQEGKVLRGLSAEALALLARYSWPGNVRQLENAVFRAVALAEGDELTVAEFPQIAARVEGFDVRIPPAAGPAQALPALVRELVRVEVRDPHTLSLIDEAGDMRSLEELEAEIIRFALAHYRGHMSEVSRRLGIGRSTLYRKLKDFGLDGETGYVAA